MAQAELLTGCLDTILLIVDQGVHRVQRDRFHTAAMPVGEGVRDDWDQERFCLAGARPGSDQRVRSGVDAGDRGDLMGEQPLHPRDRLADLCCRSRYEAGSCHQSDDFA
ncbi:hypothetical protein F4559_005543 [Saccharothrix violaceirubra]|uniref:Uncharacterized protein n=1 Tax=Saccharothrix violaceirubra TaxID=413306 RepID=A0A7W7T7U9_9PSEU|nr:hypothetical protein [Saccharothrix violaceirubra]MBB4968184.1 hypothetical protein [Saccharothrix violaceirubra]